MRSQKNVLKKAQRRILDVTSMLNLSTTVMRMIERRSSQDKCVLVPLLHNMSRVFNIRSEHLNVLIIYSKELLARNIPKRRKIECLETDGNSGQGSVSWAWIFFLPSQSR